MTIDHPTYQKLLKLKDVATRRFPSDTPGYKGFDHLGLHLLPELEKWEYFFTPRNAWAFAHTGGNGVHFSFLESDGSITESSPVVITIPSPNGLPNYIVGENLYDFLCFGIYRGYFALEQLPSDRLFDAYSSPEWQPETSYDSAVGYGVDQNALQLLGLLRDEFLLVPWREPREKFTRLQETYLPLLEVNSL